MFKELSTVKCSLDKERWSITPEFGDVYDADFFMEVIDADITPEEMVEQLNEKSIHTYLHENIICFDTEEDANKAIAELTHKHQHKIS